MLEALIDRIEAVTPPAMAALARRRLRSKIPQLTEALDLPVHRAITLSSPGCT